MTEKAYATPFAANLRKVIDHARETVNSWCIKHIDAGINQSRINRVLTGQVCGQLDTVEQVSIATGFAPWQLLHPDFDPRHEPPMLDADARRVAAIYAGIKSEPDRRKARAIMEQFDDTTDAPQESPTPMLDQVR